MSKTVALGIDWLNDEASDTNMQFYGNSTSDNINWATTGYCSNCRGWPCHCHTTYYVNWPVYTSGKIRLTMTEVQKLRAAAKKDAALKAVLQKFTPHIEVEVDF